MGCRKKVRLSDVAELTPGFAFKSTDFGEYSHKAIKITNISREGYSDAFPGVDIDAYPAGKLDKYLIGEGDYYLAMTGSIGKVGRLVRGSAYLNQRVLGLKAKSQIDADYLWFVLNSADFHRHLLTHIDSHSVQANISAESVGSFEFDLPPMNVQLRIGFVLGSFDKKIIANNRINGYLLDFLKAKSKSIYGPYEDNASRLPTGWKRVKVSDVASFVTRGITPKYNDESNQIVLGQTCIRGNLVLPENGRRHDPKKITDKWLQKGDLLINSTGVGSLGRTAQIWFDPKNMVVDSHVTIVRTNRYEDSLYLAFWAFSHERYIESLHTGSTGQTELPRDNVKAMELVFPDEEELSEFNSIAIPMTEQITANQLENRQLEKTRDTLLPKLMSGEIDVSKVEVPTPPNSHLSAD